MPLPARLEPWQVALCEQPSVLAEWLDEHGSPLNVIDPAALMRNAVELQAIALEFDLDLKIFFARKANKSLTLVDEARRHGLGIDVASEVELRQALDAGVPPGDLVVTAAIKPRALLELCVESRATVVIDNEDELRLLGELAAGAADVPVALRLGPGLPGTRATTRFGLAPLEILGLLDRFWPDGPGPPLTIAGVHFHLDGYAAADRVLALSESLDVIEMLSAAGPCTRVRRHRRRHPDQLPRRRGIVGALLAGASRRPARHARPAHVRRARPRPAARTRARSSAAPTSTPRSSRPCAASGSRRF